MASYGNNETNTCIERGPSRENKTRGGPDMNPMQLLGPGKID